MAKKTDIRLRRSNVANAIPGAANLSDGELAMNTMDGALYFKKSNGTIITAHDNSIMHISSSSDKVGIGTTSPQATLDSVGTIRATDSSVLSGGKGLEVRYFTDSDYGGILSYDRGNSAYKPVRIEGSDAQIALSGTGKFYFTSTGLGIGQPSPVHELHIKSESPSIRLQDSDGTNQFTTFTQNGGAFQIFARNGSNVGSIQFQGNDGSSSTEYARFNTSGYLLVGKTDSSFTTNGTEIRGGNLGARVIRQNAEPLTLHRRSSDGDIQTFYKDSTKVGSIESATNTTNDISVGSGDVRLLFFQNGSAIVPRAASNASADNTIDLGNTGNRFKDLYLSGTATVAGGIIHLGTADSSSGHLNSKELMTFNIDTDNDDTNRYFAFYKNGESGSGTELMRLTEDGRLGIGITNPSRKFVVRDSGAQMSLLSDTDGSSVINFGDTADDNAGRIHYNNDTDAMFIRTATVDRITILSSGNVGIGTTTPTENLHVGGGARFNGLVKLYTNAGSTYGISEALRIDNAGGNTDRQLQFYETLHSGVREHIIGYNTDITTDGSSAYTYTQGNYGGSSAIRFGNSGQIQFFSDAQVSSGSTDTFTPTEVVRFAQNGRVGIGTTNPSHRLHVLGSSTNQTAVTKIQRVQASASNNTYTFEVDSSAHTSNMTSGGAMAVDVNGGRAFTINGMGNVGIGTSSPAATLEVENSSGAMMMVDDTNGRFIKIRSANSGSQNANISSYAGLYLGGADNASHMLITNTGDVGIGTNAPGQKLEVAGRVRATTDPTFEVYEASNKRGGLQWNAGSDYLNLFTVGGHISISTNGNNVGIDTTSPTHKLHVNGQAKFEGAITAVVTSGGGAALSINHTGNENWSFDARSGSGSTDYVDFGIAGGTRCMTWQEDGNVGIGTTSPSNKLDVNGAIRLMGNGTGNDSHILYFNNGGAAIARDSNDLELHGYNAIVFGVSNTSYPTSTERMRINASGNVGIGTASPNSLLHISHDSAPTFRLSRTGTGQIWVQSIDSSGRLHISEAASEGGTQYTRLKIDDTGEITFNEAFTFPTSIGSAGQVLKVPASGTSLIWGNASGGGSGSSLEDTDGDTKIQVEESADEDIIRFDIAGSQKMLLDSTQLNLTGDLAVSGNLNIAGDINSTSVTNLDVTDKTITMANNSGSSVNADGAGIIIEGPTSNASLLWDHGNQYLELNKSLFTPASFIIGTTATNVGRMYNSSGVMALEAYTSRQISFGNADNGEHVRIDADGDVGIGTTAPSAKLHIVNNSTSVDALYLESTDASSSAAPVLAFKRNSSSIADADYLGQLKFKGENDADEEVVYAKITSKIQDASDGTEDGLIEFANRKAGSNVITARLRSDSLQLLNGTALTVGGDITLNSFGDEILFGSSSNKIGYATWLMSASGGGLIKNVAGPLTLNPDDYTSFQVNDVEHARLDGSNFDIESGGFRVNDPGNNYPFAVTQYGYMTSRGAAITQLNATGDHANVPLSVLADVNSTRSASYVEVGDIGSAGNKFIVNSSGKVGIGTTALTNKFHVSGDARIEGSLMAGGAAASNVPARPIHVKSSGDAAAIRIEDTTSSNQVFDFRVTHNSGLRFIDVTQGTTPMFIGTNGKVGIGTTSPGRRFTVQGGSGDNLPFRVIGGAGTSHGSMEFKDPNTTADYKVTIGSKTDDFYIQAGGSEKVRVESGGNVGINDTNPDRKVSIIGDNTSEGQYPLSLDATNTDYTLEFRRNGQSEWWIKQAGSSWNIHENGVGDQFRIKAGGDIGIGTTNPLAKLHVRGKQIVGEAGDTDQAPVFFEWVKSNTGSTGNGVWYKVADISLPNQGYSAIAFSATYVTGINNFGDHDYIRRYENFITIVRNNTATANNSPDTATVRGVTDDIRVYKTGTGTYELQARGNADNMEYHVEVKVFQGGTRITPIMGGSTAGTTSGGTAFTVATMVNGSDGIIRHSGVTNSTFFNASQGSASAPSITFENDTNTGLYRYTGGSEDRLGIATAGGLRVNFGTHGVESSANVYTGSGSAFRNYGGVWAGTTGVANNGFYFLNTANGNSVKALELSAAGALTHRSNYIQTAGSWQKQGTNGNVTIASNGNELAFSRNGTNYIDAPAASGNFAFRTGTSYATRMSITSAGIVGIGTASPNSTCSLEVYRNGADSVVRIHDDAGTHAARLHLRSGGNDARIQLPNTSDGLEFRTEGNLSSGTAALTLQTNGRADFGYAVRVEEYQIDTSSTTTTATTQVAIHTFPIADFRTARFTIQITNSTDSTYHSTEIIAVHDGTTANITEFGEVHTGSSVEATFDSDISSGNFRLLATPTSTNSMTFKVVCHSITV